MFKAVQQHWIMFFALLLLILMSLPLLYFSNLLKIIDRPSEESFPGQTNASLDIGVSLNHFFEERWLTEKEVMMEEAKNQGLSIMIKVAHQSLNRQIKQITYLINQNIKVLILNPVSNSGLAEVLAEARRKGIKIIFYDELTNGSADLYVGVDYRAIGKLQSTLLVQQVGSGNYLIFRGPQDSYKAEMLYNGQHNALLTRKNLIPNFVTVETLSNWSAAEAINKVRVVNSRQTIKCILAPNDLIAGEIINFYKEQKLPLPLILGMGGEISACQRILKDEQFSTIYMNSQELAKSVIVYAKELIQNKKILLPNHFNYHGRKIPIFLAGVVPVMKSNLKSLLVDQMKVYTIQDLITD